MLTIDIGVNGTTIGRLAVFNRGAARTGASGVDLYDYRIDLDNTQGPRPRADGRILHRRSDGAFELVRKVMTAVSLPKCPACKHEAIPHQSAAGPTVVCNNPGCGEVTLESAL